MTGQMTRRLWTLHRITGVIVTLNLALLSLTGVLLIFRSELELASLGDGGGTASLPLPALIAAAEQAHPGLRPLALDLQKNGGRHLGLFMQPPGIGAFDGATEVIVSRADGTLTESLGHEATDWLLDLHASLLLGFPGKVLVGGFGLALFGLIGSGLVLYGPFMKRAAFGTVRKNPRGARLRDTHKLIGGVSGPFLVVVSLSGAILALEEIPVTIWQMTELVTLTADAPDQASDPPVSLSRAFDAAGLDLDDPLATFVLYPGNELTGEHHYTVFRKGKEGLAENLFTLVLIDAAAANTIQHVEPPWYLTVLLLSGPLHFGNYGGLPLKLAWAGLGLGAFGLSLTGAWAFAIRRRSTITEESP
ncbi:MAG: PepSY-associated TM helix domain-containing protein [Myxococcota bacterium]